METFHKFLKWLIVFLKYLNNYNKHAFLKVKVMKGHYRLFLTLFMHRVQGCCKESIVLGFVARGTKRCMLSPLETEAVVGTFCKVCKHFHEVSSS